MRLHGSGHDKLTMWARLNAWRLARYRAFEWGPENPSKPYHITFTPRPGCSFPWWGGRIRIAWHHGVQLVAWSPRLKRWSVQKQVLGRSRVVVGRNGETEQPGT